MPTARKHRLPTRASPAHLAAVLLAPLAATLLAPLAATLPAQASLEKRVTAALDRARPALLEMSKRTTAGTHALLCLALADDGMTRDDHTFAGAIDRLARTRMSQTYELSIRLMVIAHVKDFPNRRRAAQRDLKALLRNQHGGGFHYTAKSSTWDLSNTQYAALGMRAAASVGVRIPADRWRALGTAVLNSKVYRGGFGYRPKSGATPSMTAAGIAVLEVCRHQLNDTGTLCKKMARAIASSWSYLDRNRSSIGRGPGSQRNYYYHYGLERAAILSDRDKVGDVDWYAAGAEMMVDEQLEDGGWGRFRRMFDVKRGAPAPVGLRASPVTTAFAVLFLRHNFQRTLTGPITPARATMARALPAQADDKAIAATIAYEVGRGLRAVPDLIRLMRSPILARRKVAAKALPRITGKFHSYSPYRSVEDSAAIIKAAEAWWLREGRKGQRQPK